MKLVIAVILALALSACGLVPITTGNADYSYTEYSEVTGKPKCKVRVYSGRIVNGVNVKGCGGDGLTASADGLEQGSSDAALGALLQVLPLIQKVALPQMAPAPAPAPTPAPADAPQTFLLKPDD